MNTPVLISIIHNFPNPEKPALYHLSDSDAGQWTPMSYARFTHEVEALGSALINLGLGEQETVGIYSENRPEVIEMNFATWQARGVVVGIYSTSTAEQVEYLINDAKIGIMLVGSQKHYDVAKSLNVRQIITVDPTIILDKDDETTLRFSQVIEMGQNPFSQEILRSRAAKTTNDDLATLVYTSGTTGQPKGAMLTHQCFSSCMEIHKRRLPYLNDTDTSMCFLPLSHVFELAWSCFCLYMHMAIYVNQDTRRIQQSLRETQPTCMCSVPHFWEKVHMVVQEKFSSMGFVSKTLMTRALAVGRKRNLEYMRKGQKVPAMLEREYQMYNGRIFRKIRSVIGLNNGRLFPTAGAPVQDQIVEFFQSIGLNLIVGYGLSETTATVTCYPGKDYVVGSVGTIMPELKMRIGDNNEIQVKGPTVLSGYYNQAESTAEAFTDDGWFRTGDAGRIDCNGNLFITDRIKDLFKTSNGKYVAPQALESRLGQDSLFMQIAIIGDQRKFVTALIVPDFSVLRKYAETCKLAHLTDKELVVNPKILAHVRERIDKLTGDLAPHEQIKRFALLTEPFTLETGELTNTLKIRRRVVADRHAALIDSLYE